MNSTLSGLDVAGLQWDLAWEDPASNHRRARELATRAAGGGARLLVLPEMFSTGFTMDAEAAVAPAEESLEFLTDLAGELGVWVLGGVARRSEDPTGRPRNAALLFDPEGRERLRYDKIHPFSLAGEDRVFEGGEALSTVAVEGVRVTPLICYDLRFPEPFRAAADATDLYIVMANWPDARVAAWRTLLAARAIENQAFVLGVNRVGPSGDDPPLPHSGASALIDPFGETLASLAHQSGLIQGRVDPDRVRSTRERFGFLADRRPEAYARL